MSDGKITYQELLKIEYKKCLESPVYFMKHYVKIKHPIRGTILFNLFKFQEETLQSFHDYKFNIILKSRQMGISTLVAAYSLWLMIFHKDKNVLLISLRQDDAKDVVAKVRDAYEELPPWLKVKCLEDNRLSMKFANGSAIKAASTTKKSGVGQALSLLIIDEAALIDEAEELWTSAQPTLSTGGNAIILSCVSKNTMVITPNGIKEVGDFIDTSKVGGYPTRPYGVLGVGKVRYGNLLHNNGVQKTNIIKTKFSELECTGNHKLWAYKKRNKMYGWYPSSELEVGDYLSIQYGKRIWGNDNDVSGFMPSGSAKIHSPFRPTTLTPELCYLMGLYVSEGSIYKVLNKDNVLIGGSLTITCGDNISWIFDRLGMTYNCWDKLHYTVSNKNLIEFMEYLGFDLSAKAHQKYIPSKLLCMNEENIRGLLRGIFDGDGSGNDHMVKLTSTSKKLIHQVRLLLSNFGIMSGVFSESVETLNRRGGEIRHNYDTYNLEIYGRYALRYYNTIGFNLERKQKHIMGISSRNFSRACSKDVVPNTLDLVKELVKSSRLSNGKIDSEHGLFVNAYTNTKTKHKSDNIARDNVLELYSLFGGNLSEGIRTYWDKVIDKDIVWCEITSIIPSENETFDFSLPEDENDFWCHSVIYNGIIGHQTPRGVGNWFHKMWQGAEADNINHTVGKNGFHPITLPWDLHPERDEEWRRVEGEKQGNPKKASQEYDCNFLASGDNFIDLNIIEFYKKNKASDPQECRGMDKNLWIWEYPDRTHSYVIAADVARGDGQDYSACHVLDISLEKPVQVAEYKGKISTKDFGDFLVALATEYNSCLLVVERENVGWGTIQEVIDREYPNTFYASADLKYVEVRRQLTNNWASEDKKLVPGFSTNIKTRPMILDNMEHYMRQMAIEIRSRRTLAEMETFVWKNGKPIAMEGYNDDLVMSLSIALWIRDTALRLRQEGTELTKLAVSGITSTQKDKTPFYKAKQAQVGHNAWKMNTGRQGFGNQNNEDLRWLLG